LDIHTPDITLIPNIYTNAFRLVRQKLRGIEWLQIILYL